MLHSGTAASVSEQLRLRRCSVIAGLLNQEGPRMGKGSEEEERGCPRLRHIITGTFNTLSLHLLAYDTLTSSLSVVKSVPAQGPHQFLALGSVIPSLSGFDGASTSSAGRSSGERIVYATTWDPVDRRVSAWKVGLDWRAETISYINSQEIPAAGSYVMVYPPPYDSLTMPAYGVKSVLSGNAAKQYLYQAGGPTGEVFPLDPVTGAIEEQAHQLVFLPGGEKDLAEADKTRKGLRYGAHNVDFDIHGIAYVAHLGRNSILLYHRSPSTGLLSPLLASIPSPGPHDGPRHVVPSPCGRWIFAVTEHNSFVDAYRIHITPSSNAADAPTSISGTHVQRVSIIPADDDPKNYRGDTLRISPSGSHIFATTRGSHSTIRGWVKGWRLDLDDEAEPLKVAEGDSVAWEAPTSGGKAHAFEWAPRYPLSQPSLSPSLSAGQEDLAVLTDDLKGYIMILSWSGEELKEVARVQLPGQGEGEGERLGKRVNEGASHAIWLS